METFRIYLNIIYTASAPLTPSAEEKDDNKGEDRRAGVCSVQSLRCVQQKFAGTRQTGGTVRYPDCLPA